MCEIFMSIKTEVWSYIFQSLFEYLLLCEYTGSSLEVKLETDSIDAMEIKTEADSNDITECLHRHLPSTGMFGFTFLTFIHCTKHMNMSIK